MAYDMANRSCMLRSCSQCPGVEPLKEHIETLLEYAGLDGDDTIKFIVSGFSPIALSVFLETSRDKFTDVLVDNLQKLRPHHFIAKAQAAYLKQQKENLDDETAIVLMVSRKTSRLLSRMKLRAFIGIIHKRRCIHLLYTLRMVVRSNAAVIA